MKNYFILYVLSILMISVSCSTEDTFLSKLDGKKYISLDGWDVITIEKNELTWYEEKIEDCWKFSTRLPPFRVISQNENSAVFQMVTDEPEFIEVSMQEEGIRIEATWGDPFYVIPTDDCVRGF